MALLVRPNFGIGRGAEGDRSIGARWATRLEFSGRGMLLLDVVLLQSDVIEVFRDRRPRAGVPDFR